MPRNSKSIIMTGYAGLSGTADLLSDRRDALEGRFSEGFLEHVKASCKTDQTELIKSCFEKYAISDYLEVSREGIFASLWEFGELLDAGMIIDIRDIPVKQETIEIANFLDVNPYEISGMGSVLAAVGEEERLIRQEMDRENIACTKIGTLNGENQRVLLNRGVKRFLTPASRIEDEKRQRGETL